MFTLFFLHFFFKTFILLHFSLCLILSWYHLPTESRKVEWRKSTRSSHAHRLVPKPWWRQALTWTARSSTSTRRETSTCLRQPTPAGRFHPTRPWPWATLPSPAAGCSTTPSWICQEHSHLELPGNRLWMFCSCEVKWLLGRYFVLTQKHRQGEAFFLNFRAFLLLSTTTTKIASRTTAIVGYAIGLWTLSDIWEVFCWCSVVESFFVLFSTDNWNYIRHLFYSRSQCQHRLYQNHSNQGKTFSFFYLGWMQPISMFVLGCSVDPTVLVPKCFTHFVEGGNRGDMRVILVDTCTEIWWHNWRSQLWQNWEERIGCQKIRLGVWSLPCLTLCRCRRFWVRMAVTLRSAT